MERQFLQNRHRLRQEVEMALLMYLCLLAEELNCTPSEHDLLEHGEVNHAMYVYYFGSLRWAQALASLIPNPIGQWGHRGAAAEALSRKERQEGMPIRPPLLEIDRMHRFRQDAHGFGHIRINAA